MSHRRSPNVTPFIPPLPSPEGAASNQAPVLPSPNGAVPEWASHPQTPAHYPIYPASPYSGAPFIPAMSANGTPALVPGSYFPPPTSLPPAAPNPNTGLSGDYTGYPQFASGPPPWALPPAAMFPGTPWNGPQSAPPQGNWGHQGRTPYVPFHGPLSAGAYAPQMYQGMPGVPQGWAMPIGPGAFSQGAFVTPGHGAISHPHTPAAPGYDTLHPAARDGDTFISPFATGEHYGPVLEPFLVRVVRADVKINPLLAPPREDDDKVYLRWNMLFVSAYCQRSTDPAHVSWSKGRKEPATFPRVTQFRVVSKSFPWMISLEAQNKSIGITCGEVIDGIADYLHRLVKGEEFKALPRAQQKKIGDAYKHNRAPAHGVPGGQLGEGVRRLDWLCQDSIFGGIQKSDSLVTEICGDVLPCTFELKCVHRYPLNAREIQEQEERNRAIARERPRSTGRSSRAPTVEPADSDDDD